MTMSSLHSRIDPADSSLPCQLRMENITKEFSGVKALNRVNLDVRREEVHAICGENGAGKSTLMKVLSGIYPYGSYSGRILLEGREQHFKSLTASEAAGIVIIHQELTLIPELSVAENIFLGNEQGRPGFINWNKTREQAVELMQRVGLDEDPDTHVKNLGVGKQQLVEICKALGKKVRILVLDEPTAALNESDSAHLLELIGGLKSKGITSIMISHKLNEIREIADRVTIIRDGHTVETLDSAVEPLDEDQIIRSMVGRALSSRFPAHTPKIGPLVYQIKDWSVRNPDNNRMVAKQVSLDFHAGEVVGLAGLMGAGRTELARSVFGRNYGQKVSGEILKNGKRLNIKHVTQAIKAGIAYVTEDRKQLGINPLDDIKTTISIAALHKILKGISINRDQEAKVAKKYREDLRIKTPSVDTGIIDLSGGNQQKVVIAKWMFTEPDLLILDEPTRGIDVGAKYEVYGIINELADQGKCIWLISSELPELLGMSDRIYTLFEGQITGEFLRGEATQERLMRCMTALPQHYAENIRFGGSHDEAT